MRILFCVIICGLFWPVLYAQESTKESSIPENIQLYLLNWKIDGNYKSNEDIKDISLNCIDFGSGQQGVDKLFSFLEKQTNHSLIIYPEEDFKPSGFNSVPFIRIGENQKKLSSLIKDKKVSIVGVPKDTYNSIIRSFSDYKILQKLSDPKFLKELMERNE